MPVAFETWVGRDRQKEVVFGHFAGLSLGTILLKSADTFLQTHVLHTGVSESFSDPETVVQDMLK